MKRKISVGISQCLLGANVRYNGGNRLEGIIVSELGKVFEFVHFCPEVDIGLGTPREAINLVKDENGFRLIGSRSGADITETMKTYAASRVKELADSGVRGLIFKSKSPSCGLTGVKMFNADGAIISETGAGLFARACVEALPHFPVAEEINLRDEEQRTGFIEQVCAYDKIVRRRPD